MKRIGVAAVMMVAMMVSSVRADSAGDTMAGAVSNYVAGVMCGLKEVADQHPTAETFRQEMKPFMDKMPGVFGASLIDTNFVIRQVYYRRDFLAVGFDLKKVGELDYFWKLMREKPEPQLSEPGHGNLVQPRLVAMRYPFMKDGKLAGIVSVLIHTEAFLSAVGLNDCSAYKIACLGKLAEQKGTLAASCHEASIKLPSTEWLIQFNK